MSGNAGSMAPRADGISMQEQLPAAPPSVATARHLLRRFAGELDVDVDAVELAVSEAVANAVVHAYADGDGEGTVELQASAVPYELQVVVRDHGRGLHDGGGGGGAGFGLPIIRRLARHVDVADARPGVKVTMTFARGGRWSP